MIDEVQTGLGRTGKFFCYEHWGLRPDIITVSKALSGGYVPVGAMLTTDRVFTSVFSSLEKAMKHSTTFGRNQLAMVAGLATLAAFDDEDIVERAAGSRAMAFEAALAPLVERYEMLHEVRGKGLMIGLEFGPPQSEALRRRFNTLEHFRPAIFSQMMVVPLFHRHRILTQVAADNVNIVKLLPPLICGQEEVDYFVTALDDVLQDAHNGSGLLFEFGRTMAKGALRRSGRARPESPVQRARSDPGVGCGAVTASSLSSRRQSPRATGSSSPGRPGSSGRRWCARCWPAGRPWSRCSSPGATSSNLEGLDVEQIPLDMRDAAGVTAAVKGARFVFHLAAMYRFWARRPKDFYDVNVGGTLNVLRRGAQQRRASGSIYTSTVGVLGLDGAAHGQPADETCYADVAHLFGLYKRTKYVAEHEVLREAAQGAAGLAGAADLPARPRRHAGPRRPERSSSNS